jgi:DNA-directed RNA polymerase specialized sigma24 family protein
MTPYTPAAISYIRQNASMQAASIARQLGWDLATLCRLAARHGIELSGAGEKREPVFTPPKRDDNPYQVHGHIDIAIDATTSLERIIDSLPLRQAQVLTVLKREIGGRFIPASEISDRIGIESKSVGSVVHTLRAKLVPSQWRLDSHNSRAGGGYRLMRRT